MTLNVLKARHFRNLDTVNVNLHADINLVFGENGAGKTSFLELLYFMVYGKSPRTHLAQPLVKSGESAFSIQAQIQSMGAMRKISITRQESKSSLEIDNKKAKRRSEAAFLLPVQFFDATTYRYLSSGPKYRREFLDWGVFHVKPNYRSALGEFKKTLQQRNMGLKRGISDSEINIWNIKLSEVSEKIDTMRGDVFRQLVEHFNKYWQELGHSHERIDLEYCRGWSNDVPNLDSELKKSLSRDRRYGFTQLGPHRADIKIKVGDQDAFSWLSQGQQKILAYALYLAQLAMLQSSQASRGLFLVDDLPAELDLEHQKKLVQSLMGVGSQLIITGIAKKDLCHIFEGVDYGLLHVKAGQLEQM